MTVRESILEAIVAALNTARPAGIPAAERARTLGVDIESMPTILVYPGRDTATDVGGRAGPIQKRSFEILVECWAAKSETATADQATDPLAAWVVCTLGDNSLGGLVSKLRDSATDFGIDDVDGACCLCSITMLAEYSHRADDLERAA